VTFITPSNREKAVPFQMKKVRNVNIGMENIINNGFNKNLLFNKDPGAKPCGFRALKTGLGTQH
jgi:hypothetical protein